MPRLPEADISGPSDDKDVDNNISTYCVVGQEPIVCSTFNDNHSATLSMPTLKDIQADQQTDTYCLRMLKLVQDSEPRFTVDEDGLVRCEAPIDGSLEDIVSEAPHCAVLYNGYHPATTRHLGTGKLYDSLRGHFY